jgi:hypothetical protein
MTFEIPIATDWSYDLVSARTTGPPTAIAIQMECFLCLVIAVIDFSAIPESRFTARSALGDPRPVESAIFLGLKIIFSTVLINYGVFHQS